MTGYYLSDGKEGYRHSLLERIYYELYLPLAISITEWFERKFGRIVGNGWGVRNWFSPSREGDWTIRGIVDQAITLFMAFVFIILLTIFVNSLISDPVDWKIFRFSLIYIIIIISSAVIIIPNYANKKTIFEFLTLGNFTLKNIKIASIILSLWIIIYLSLSKFAGLTIQQTILIMQQQIIATTFLLILFQILIIPIIETLWFACAALPSFTRFLGILPGIVITSLFSGGIHYFVLQGNIYSVFMSILFGLLFYPLVLKYGEASFALIAHIEANTLALILNGLIR